MDPVESASDWPPPRYAALHHFDRAQLIFQVTEIVAGEAYLRHGIELDPGATVFDVGANVGVAATFFAEHGAGAIHSFEPVEPVRRLLERNVGGLEPVEIHPYGLGARNEIREITYYPGADAMSGLYADPERDAQLAATAMENIGERPDYERLRERYRPETMPCELRSLSSVLAELAVERIDLLKIDVERAELEVLEGIEPGDWERISQLVAEVHDTGGRLAKVAASLESRGFGVVVEQDTRLAGTDVWMAYARR